MYALRCIVLVAIIAAPASAEDFAVSEPVEILRFTREGDTGFTLSVKHNARFKLVPDSFFGSCEVFTVHGEFKRLRLVGSSPVENLNVTRQNHIRALVTLDDAFQTRREVWLGHFGNGFVPIDKNDPCRVTTRALTIDRHGEDIIVWSYHDAA